MKQKKTIAIRKVVSIPPEQAKYIDNYGYSLSKLVQLKIKEMMEKDGV